MTPIISIIMGSTSDLPVMEKACKWLNDNEIPFEVNALSAHRTPEAVETFARNAKQRGIKVIIAAAGMSAALPGVIAASTPLPVRGPRSSATTRSGPWSPAGGRTWWLPMPISRPCASCVVARSSSEG